MALKGDVASIGLEEVFGFLSANASQGVLVVHDGRADACRLYFRDGRIFLPLSDHDGIRTLTRAVGQDGVLARAWEGVVRELRKRSDRFRRLVTDKTESQRRRFTEEVHDLFLWDEARFEFHPGELPAPVNAELAAGRGLSLEPQAIVMEVARRADERARVRRAITSGRMVLVARPGCEAAIAQALQQRGVDPILAPFDGNRPLDAQLEAWGGSQWELLSTLASLVENRQLEPLPGPETRARIQTLLAGGNLSLAAGLLGHLAEVDGPESALRMALELSGSPAFRGQQEVGCTWSTDGPRAFAFLGELLAHGAPFTLTLRHLSGARRVALLPGVLSLQVEGPSEAGELERYLVQLGHLKPDEVPSPASSGNGEGATRLGERIGRAAVEQALVEQFLDQLAETALWRRCEVELKNRGIPARDGDPTVAVVSLSPAASRRLREGLAAWSSVIGLVPGLDAVFVRGAKARSQVVGDGGLRPLDPAAKFFARFSAQRNLGELCRLSEAPRLQFVRLAAQGVKNGYLRRPALQELLAWVQEARAQGNEVGAYRLVRAGVAFGHREELGPALASYRGRELLPGPEPALQGDLRGIGLPGLLQSLHEHRRTGTLSVSAQGREERLCFYQGDAFVLGQEGGAPAQDRFLEVMFWEEATFAFRHHDLPEEFFAPPPGTAKVALETHRFLLETVQRMDRWDAVRRVLGSGRAVLEFVDAEARQEALRGGTCAKTLHLVDGTLTFEELLLRGGQPRLEVGRVVAELVEAGSMRVTR